MKPPTEIVARETRLALPVAIASMLAVICIIVAPTFLINGFVSGDGDAALLRSVDDNGGAFLAALIVRALGYLLLIAPLVYLFRAAADREITVRRQMVGVLYAAPVFLAVYSILIAITTIDAASAFVAEHAALTGSEANEAARDLINDSSLRAAAAGFQLAGQLGFAVGMAYTVYQAMKVGLLTRFWGSLGAALGAISFLFPQFALFWFIYFGLLVAGWVPGGRPPAWPAGEAQAWPKPGEDDDDLGEGYDDPAAPDRPAGQPGADPEAPPTPPPGPVRKRKRRS